MGLRVKNYVAFLMRGCGLESDFKDRRQFLSERPGFLLCLPEKAETAPSFPQRSFLNVQFQIGSKKIDNIVGEDLLKLLFSVIAKIH